ncbi:MAG: DUF411 domain-containing protein [Xanthobacteraceae bacterium]|nr:DUF411 domain-containing protein [Xanthobacteraceae bacterium]
MRLLGFALLTLALVVPARAQEPPKQATLYKSPDCTCCEGHAAYLRRNGIQVKIIETPDLTAVKKANGVPAEFEGCHTILLDGYVIEGHVPITPIRKLLRERPAIKGISLPGMPLGSPGMTGTKEGPFVIYEISEGEKRVYSTE